MKLIIIFDSIQTSPSHYILFILSNENEGKYEKTHGMQICVDVIQFIWKLSIIDDFF